MSKKETSLNTPDPAGIATPLPDFLVGTAGVGNEAVTAQDVTFPRIGIIQALSPEIQKDHAKFIPGAQTGDLFDTLTRKIVPQPMRLLDCYFQKTFGVFKNRDAGGGFRGQFADQASAEKFVAADPQGSLLEIVDTGIHVCLLLDADMQPITEAIVMFTKTKQKVSRQINAILKGKGVARCATLWEVTTVGETNSKNQPYYNFKFTDMGFIQDKALFDRAMRLYNDVKDRTVSAADAGDTDDVPDADRF